MSPAALTTMLKSLFWHLLGRFLERRGQGNMAIHAYRQALAAHPPRHARLPLRLAALLQAQRQFRASIEYCQQAIALSPAEKEALVFLGLALRAVGDAENALAQFRSALASDPFNADARNGVGLCLLDLGRADEALDHFDALIAQEPTNAKWRSNRVAALVSQGRFDEAQRAANEEIAKGSPFEAVLRFNLGNARMGQGDVAGAMAAYRECLQLDPALGEARFALAQASNSVDDFAAAIDFLEVRLREQGRRREILERLSVAYRGIGDQRAALSVCEELLAQDPFNAQGLLSYVPILGLLGRVEEAYRLLARCIAEGKGGRPVHSLILFAAHAVPALPQEEVFDLHKRFCQRYLADCQPAAHAIPGPQAATRRDRKLRIAYLSPDLMSHPGGHLLAAALRGRNRASSDVILYSTGLESDYVTRELHELADAFHDVALAGDAEIAERIRADRIDILVDLAGHTDRNRIAVFAMKPAPIQVSWLGYFFSTGLPAIDYFISDPWTSPLGSRQPFAETFVHLPHTRFCFRPPPFLPEVTPAPHVQNGYVTFGCFNRLDKINDGVLAAWAAILKAMPDARLLLKALGLEDEMVRDAMLARLARLGVPADRLILRGRSSHPVMLAEHADMDIALDPFPFSGGMTTFEALAMGVPVVTLAEDSVVSRQSLSALANVGLDDLAFANIDDYCAGALALARDSARMVSLRASLRLALLASPLGDGQRFARDLDTLYHAMWEAWCRGEKLPPGWQVPGGEGCCPGKS